MKKVSLALINKIKTVDPAQYKALCQSIDKDDQIAIPESSVSQEELIETGPY